MRRGYVPVKPKANGCMNSSDAVADVEIHVEPISEEQLGTEVKGIYASLVMVEAKCINIDSQKASHPDEPIDAD